MQEDGGTVKKPHRHRLVTLPPEVQAAEGMTYRCLGCKARLKDMDGGIVVDIRATFKREVVLPTAVRPSSR